MEDLLDTRVFDQKYRLDTRAASGGHGPLPHGRLRLGHPAAVKVCDRHLTADAEERERFLDEGDVSNKIGVEYVLHALDVESTHGTTNGVPSGVHGRHAEHICVRPGGSAAKRLVVSVALQALGALGAPDATG